MTYETMAEFHDLFMEAAWERLAPLVADTFGGLGPDDVVLDLGAGTGLGAASVVEHTAARVWCLEPSPAMRAVLLHRVAASPAARSRVSVVAGSAPRDLDALPAPASGVLLTHVLGHLSGPERGALWAWLAGHLAPGGAALVTVHPDAGPAEVVEETTLGEHLYRATHRSTADRFATRYDVLDRAGAGVRSSEVSGTWRPLSADDLRAEVAEVGLRCRETPLAGTTLIVL